MARRAPTLRKLRREWIRDVAIALSIVCFFWWAASPSVAIADEVANELRFNEGLILFEKGDFSGALAAFDDVATHNVAASTYAELCREQMDPGVTQASYVSPDCCAGLEAPACGDACSTAVPRPWRLSFLTGYQYDSNVTLLPEFQGLGSGAGIEDSAWFEAIFGDYQLVQSELWNLGAIGSAYANHYFEANEFDAQDFMGGGYANVLLTDFSFAGVRYEFHESLLDYDQFAREHRLVSNVSILEGDLGHSTFYYEYDDRSFDAAPLIPALDRGGIVNSVGATQAFYAWQGLGRIFFGYRHDWADADGSDFDRLTNMVTGRIERPVGERFVTDFEVRQFWDDYENSNSLDYYGAPREDDRTEVRAGLQFFWTDHVSLRADYTFINSNSNTSNLFGVRFYDYDRHLLTTQVVYDF